MALLTIPRSSPPTTVQATRGQTALWLPELVPSNFKLSLMVTSVPRIERQVVEQSFIAVFSFSWGVLKASVTMFLLFKETLLSED